jgi:hypothetical protein
VVFKNLLFIFICAIGYVPILKAQSLPPILERAAQENRELILVSLSNKSIFPLTDLPSNFSTAGVSFVKKKDQLLMLPQGTGRVYQLEGQPGERKWIRIDSTFFTGYNFGFFPFVLDDKIYSFGGHGLWYTNGNLRFYNETGHEWNVKLLNESISWSWYKEADAYLHLDTAAKKMTIRAGGVTENNMLTNTKDLVHGKNIYQLDIPSGEWTKLGNAKDTGFNMMAVLPWGLLVDQTTVLDFQNNRYLHFNDELHIKMRGLTSRSTEDNTLFLSFAIDSTLYFGNLTDPYDSLVISQSDLIDTGVPIYTKEEKTAILSMEDTKSIIILLLAIICLTLAFLYWKKIRPQPMLASINLPNPESAAVAKPDTEPEKSVTFRSTRILDLLEERERSLLAYLYKHSADERLTTIEEINKVIGVSNRSNEIQKRMRSDLIGSINQKLNIIAKDKKPVIDKQRSEFDKRSFEYFIQPSHMELVEKVLGKK